MTPKVCLLTGATSGIGQAAAIDLARQGYELFLVARSKTKAAATSKKVMAKTPDAKLTWLYGDLSRQSDVRSIAGGFLSSGKQIDLLFLNAGVCYNQRVLSPDGYEMMLAVNHLAPFLLTNLLFENLCQGESETRVVITASGAYKSISGLNLDDMNFEKNFKTFPAYGNSKLANILFTQELARKLETAGSQKTFTVNCFHPGFVGTGIGTQVWLGKILMAVCRPFVRSSEKGAETGLFLAIDPSIEGQSGGYYHDCKQEKLRPYAKDTSVAEPLWSKSEEMVSA